MSDLVRVATVGNEPEADLAVGLLRTEGIDAVWQRADFAPAGAGLGSAGGVGGPFVVLVRPPDAERARELLSASDDE